MLVNVIWIHLVNVPRTHLPATSVSGCGWGASVNVPHLSGTSFTDRSTGASLNVLHQWDQWYCGTGAPRGEAVAQI